MSVPVEAVVSLDAVSAVGPGTTIDFVVAKALVSMVLVSNGPVSGGVVAVEASHDGTNWVKVEGLAPQADFHQFAQPTRGVFRYWRANVLAEVTGGTVSATFMEAG